jgi:hypothetical protein
LSQKAWALYDIASANLEQTDFCLLYQGPDGVDSSKWTKHSLFLHATGREASASHVQARIPKEQARRILDELAASGYLDRATDYTGMLLEPMAKNRPGYLLFVWVRDGKLPIHKLSLLEDLSQGADVAKVAQGLRAVLEGEAAAAADKVLREMGIEPTTPSTRSTNSWQASSGQTQPAVLPDEAQEFARLDEILASGKFPASQCGAGHGETPISSGCGQAD